MWVVWEIRLRTKIREWSLTGTGSTSSLYGGRDLVSTYINYQRSKGDPITDKICLSILDWHWLLPLERERFFTNTSSKGKDIDLCWYTPPLRPCPDDRLQVSDSYCPFLFSKLIGPLLRWLGNLIGTLTRLISVE